MNELKLNTEFDPQYGNAININEDIVRITCNNPSPFTFTGTNTYIIGEKNLGIIDPGPKNQEHLEAIMDAIAGRAVSHILITHTHSDHSPLARELQEITKAKIVAQGKHKAARKLKEGEQNPLDASADYEFEPDEIIKHEEIIENGEWQLIALHTPGHTANHMAFAQKNREYMFSGDHVMGWATTIVAPPDGAMDAYMKSLKVMLQHKQQIYLPAHGDKIENAHEFVRALQKHRKMREKNILQQIKKGENEIMKIVKQLYQSVDPKLHGAAALSVSAHLEDLINKKKVKENNGKYHLNDE